MQKNQLRRLRVLQKENARLKGLLAEKELDIDVLNEVAEAVTSPALPHRYEFTGPPPTKSPIAIPVHDTRFCTHRQTMMRHPDPLAYDNERMSIETYHQLHRHPGFTYEYVGGIAQVSVQFSASAVVAAPPSALLDVAEDDARPEADVAFERAGDADESALIVAWVDAFACTPDHHNYRVKAIRDDVRTQVTELFSKEQRMHPASVVTRWNGSLVGALLVSADTARPSISSVFVRRDVRRRGLATAMARRAARTMAASGERVLCSAYLLATARVRRGTRRWDSLRSRTGCSCAAAFAAHVTI